jgi:HEAT repeat protein
MNTSRRFFLTAFSILSLLTIASPRTRVACADDDLVKSVSDLVCDKDKDVRAVGLEQVRDEVKGSAATLRFVALLPKLAPEAQTGLLGALAERGDAAARPAVLEFLNHSSGEARGAAIRALGALGDKDDVPRLTHWLAQAGSEADATAAITRLHGEGINAAICAEMKTARPALRVKLLQLLVVRHAIDCQPVFLEAAKDADAGVRIAALEALGQLAGPEGVARLAHLILDSKDALAREEAEKALMLVAQRDPKVKVDARALPLLKVMSGLGEKERMQLFPALGHIGGSPALKVIEAALADSDPVRRLLALQALCNWPDGSVAPQLVELVRGIDDSLRNDDSPRKLDPSGVRKMLVDALIRVAPLPDKRPNKLRLAMLEKAMELSSSHEQRAMVLKRAPAILSLDTLHFVVPYMDQPEFTQLACKSVVELAHHKELRQPNKAEFDKALDRVLELSTDPEVVLRANHYKKDETWVEKQIKK